MARRQPVLLALAFFAPSTAFRSRSRLREAERSSTAGPLQLSQCGADGQSAGLHQLGQVRPAARTAHLSQQSALQPSDGIH
jgi:hypothetical protein